MERIRISERKGKRIIKVVMDARKAGEDPYLAAGEVLRRTRVEAKQIVLAVIGSFSDHWPIIVEIPEVD